jgi:hypothetical protein
MVDSLKVLDPNRPIREAEVSELLSDVRFSPPVNGHLTSRCHGGLFVFKPNFLRAKD